MQTMVSKVRVLYYILHMRMYLLIKYAYYNVYYKYILKIHFFIIYNQGIKCFCIILTQKYFNLIELQYFYPKYDYCLFC